MMSYAPPKPAAKAFDQHKRLIVVQVAAVVAIVPLLFTKPFLVEGSDGHEYIEALGIGFVLICILGRLWSILYVGGRKNDELVTIGPFSMTRNPLSPRGSSTITSKRSTFARSGPTPLHATISSTAASEPSNAASTPPSGRLRTYPVRPSPRARRAQLAR